MRKRNILIVGSSGHAKVVIDIVEREGKYKITGLIDRFRKKRSKTMGYEISGREEDVPYLEKRKKIHGIVIAIGENFLRANVVERISRMCPGIKYVNAIHPGAMIARDVFVGDGTVIMPGVVVNASCNIGQHCILNTHSSLDHDSTMGMYSSLAPNAATGGTCRIGEYSAVGIGATLIQGVKIGAHSVIGAGATLVKDVPSFSVAYGTPAKTIRKRKRGDRYL